MHIRRMQPGEELALFEVFHSAIHMLACNDYSVDQIQAWAPRDVDVRIWIERMRAINPFVAVIDQLPVGFADIQADRLVDHFFVSGHHARQGVGTALMQFVLGEARRLGISQLRSDVSRTAVPFFERFGFVVVVHRRPVRRGVAIPNARMCKTM